MGLVLAVPGIQESPQCSTHTHIGIFSCNAKSLSMCYYVAKLLRPHSAKDIEKVGSFNLPTFFKLRGEVLSDFFVKLHSRVDAGNGNLGKRWKIYRFNIGHFEKFFFTREYLLDKVLFYFCWIGQVN